MWRAARPFRSAVLLAAALVTSWPAEPLCAADLGTRARALVEAIPQGEGLDAAGKRYAIGHLELVFESGRLYPVQAGDETVGFFFDGRGRFAYTSDDPLEAASFATSVKRATKYKRKGGRIEGGVKSAVVWDPSALPRLAGDDEWSAGDAPSTAVQSFLRQGLRFEEDEYVPTVNFVVQALIERPDPPAVHARIVGEHDLVYFHDTLRTADESLSVMRKDRRPPPAFKESRFAHTLSVQPLGRARLDPRPVRFAIREVDLVLVNAEKRSLALEVRETIEALTDLRTLEFGLWHRRKNVVLDPGAPNEAPYRLVALEGEDGKPLPFSHWDNDLVVELPQPLAAGERITLRFQLEGDILFRPGMDSYWELPIAAWLPLPARLDMQDFTYHAVIKVARPFVPFSNGKTLRRWEEGPLACAEFRPERPIQFPVVLAGKYTTHTQEIEGLTLHVSSYATAKDRAVREVAANVLRMIGFYEELLGEFPFNELKVIEINQPAVAVAPAGIIFMAKGAFEQGFKSRDYSVGINSWLAHEVAHMWWGHVAWTPGFEDQWLSESTAEYFSVLATSELWPQQKFGVYLRQWRQEAGLYRESASLYLANFIGGHESHEDRRGLLYHKGPLVLHALRNELGDELFFELMRRCMRDGSPQQLYTREVIEMTNALAERDLTAWFQNYLLGTGWPETKR